jgi:hypothetical protein
MPCLQKTLLYFDDGLGLDDVLNPEPDEALLELELGLDATGCGCPPCDFK